MLAQTEIDEAAGGDATEIQKANAHLSKGDPYASQGKYPEAIDRYREAWKHARHA
jgi:hypothetical protein